MFKLPVLLVHCQSVAARLPSSVLARRCFGCGKLKTLSLLPSQVQNATKSCGFSSKSANVKNLANENTSDPSQEQVTDSSQNIDTASAEKLLQESQVHDVEPPEFPSDVTEKWGNYKNRHDWARSQSRHAFRPRIDPKQVSVVVFPGQGAQFVGMASNLLDYPNVVQMFNVASEILNYDLLDICLNGPKEKLDKTIHCQAAIMVTSLAAIEKLKDERPQAIENCMATAGFSSGEFAALVFAGSMSFEDAIRVLKVRAEAMQQASEATPGGMMIVHLHASAKLNFACHTARQYCIKRLDMERPVCAIANYLYPECKVIAGHMEALEFVEKNAADFGIARVKWLPVSGAFHTPLMRSVKKPLQEILRSVTVEPPIISVHSNVTSHRYNRPESIVKLLTEQVTSPVKWEQTLHVLYSRPQGEDFPTTYEMGPGRQLGPLLKRTNEKAFEHYTNITS